MRNHELQDIESELRRAAGELHRLCDKPAPVHALVAEHGRRQRRRLARRACGAGVLLVCIAAASLARLQPLSEKAVTPGDLAVTSPEVVENHQGIVPTQEVTTDLAKAIPPETLPDLLGTSASKPMLVPIVLVPASGDGESVITTAIYVPEHTESLRLQDLSPAERCAVRRVLGIEEDVWAQPTL